MFIRGAFKTLSNIYDGVFYEKSLTAKDFLIIFAKKKLIIEQYTSFNNNIFRNIWRWTPLTEQIIEKCSQSRRDKTDILLPSNTE